MGGHRVSLKVYSDIDSTNMIFDRRATATQWRKYNLSANGTGITGHPQAKKRI